MRKKSKQVLITLLAARPPASKGEGGSKNIYKWTFYNQLFVSIYCSEALSLPPCLAHKFRLQFMRCGKGWTSVSAELRTQ